MPNDIANLSLTSPWVVATFAFLTFSALVVALIPLRSRLSWRRFSLVVATAGVTGLIATVVYSVAVHATNGDGQVTPLLTHVGVALGCAGIAAAIYAMVIGRGWRRATAIPLVVIAPLFSAIQINAADGSYPDIRSLLVATGGYDITQPLASLDASDVAPNLLATTQWRVPEGMPSQGAVVTITIPATVSGFAAREASVYLPPAALTANPPKLPIIIALSGQPGSPFDWLYDTEIPGMLDQVAADNSGIAPIVVSPDQLGAPEDNPMCVDGPLGNVATYLMVDVRNWILANFPASSDRLDWTMAGFSEGATCTMELGAGHPEIFGQLVAVAPELVPSIGTPEETVAIGFSGDVNAYNANSPVNVLKANAPSNQVLVAGAGALDDEFTLSTKEIVATAQSLGMNATFIESPETGHDFDTVRYVFGAALPMIVQRAGLQN